MIEFNEKFKESNAIQIVWRAIIINLLNPKLTLFFFAFLPQFVSPQSKSATVELLILSFVFMLMTFSVFSLYGLIASGLSPHIVKSKLTLKKTQRVFAVAIAGFAVRLAISEN